MKDINEIMKNGRIKMTLLREAYALAGEEYIQ